jgi:hypothetical protein
MPAWPIIILFVFGMVVFEWHRQERAKKIIASWLKQHELRPADVSSSWFSFLREYVHVRAIDSAGQHLLFVLNVYGSNRGEVLKEPTVIKVERIQ